MHTFCSLLTKFSSTKSVQTTFVAPQNPLIDTFLVIKVINYQLRQFHSYASDEKNLRHDLVFLIFTDKNFASNKRNA